MPTVSKFTIDEGEWRVRGGRRIEWQTVVLAVVVHGAIVGVLWAHRAVPGWLTVPVLAVLGAWFGSLQHEVIHRHPTPSAAFNRLAVPLPLALWVPFERYRQSHLAHHDSDLTMPGHDPETFYCTPDEWSSMGPFVRRITWVNCTILGRLTIGPAIAMVKYGRYEITQFRRDAASRPYLVSHVVEMAVTAWLVFGGIGFPVWQYLVGFCYFGTALTMLRSFAEHRPINGDHQVFDGMTRSAVVRSAGFFGLMFLNNNLHHTHHARPGVAWYRLKQVHAEMGSDEIAAAGAGWYRSYGELIWRYLVRPFCQPEHPLLASVEP